MYDLHNLQGQFSSCHFLIIVLKACNNVFLLKFIRNNIPVFLAPEYFQFHKKYFLNLVIQVVKTVVNCNHYSLIEIIVSR